MKKEQQPEKKKRELTPEQLEKIKFAREKANEVRKKNVEIKRFEREQIEKKKKESKKAIESKRFIGKSRPSSKGWRRFRVSRFRLEEILGW